MRTSKPISTISYNTPDFLRNKIEYWKATGIIEFGMWITHQPDEDNKKIHHHVFLKPAKLIQTMDLEEGSLEIDPNNDKPLKMISFRVSKESDWILYGIHDPTYLAEKGMSRNLNYDFSDIQTTCDETLQDMITHLVDDRKGRLEYRIMDCIANGFTWRDIVGSGIIPLRQIHNAHQFYNAITYQIQDRPLKGDELKDET